MAQNLTQLATTLRAVRTTTSFEPAANRAAEAVWPFMDRILTDGDPTTRRYLLDFAIDALPLVAAARVCRRLAKSPDLMLRDRVRKLLAAGKIREVALPGRRNGNWDATGWFAGLTDAGLARHPTGSDTQADRGVPTLLTVADVRELLGIASPAQLGYFLLASDAGNGPYTAFTIPKRDGSERVIHAPKAQLKWVQRQILEKILSPLPAHDAAHGFVPGRSTVTNAAPHTGAAIVVKFDLAEFFPTVNYSRVLGLFASLGYPVGNARFGTSDGSSQVAPVLARLCCHTPDPKSWGTARLPQGAPTSPAISNLVCRRLDARLAGLAEKTGGRYTRYADDLTLSYKADTARGLNIGRLRWWVDQVCQQEGFRVHQGKFRVIRAGRRQTVTGLVVNDTVHVPREARRRFRAILTNCGRHGVASQANGNPRFAEYLRGFASYVHMVDPVEGGRLLARVTDLLGPADGPPPSEESA